MNLIFIKNEPWQVKWWYIFHGTEWYSYTWYLHGPQGSSDNYMSEKKYYHGTLSQKKKKKKKVNGIYNEEDLMPH